MHKVFGNFLPTESKNLSKHYSKNLFFSFGYFLVLTSKILLYYDFRNYFKKLKKKFEKQDGGNKWRIIGAIAIKLFDNCRNGSF